MSVNIGIIGLGTVGGGVWKVLNKKRSLISSRVGAPVKIKKVCDVRKSIASELKIPKEIFTSDWKEIVNDKEISLVVVLTGSVKLGYEIITSCFKQKKHVVTANKALIAEKWDDIFSLARDNKCLIYFEASAGSGIPVIQGINEGLASNDITKIKAILNGTSNYILTKMARELCTLEYALGEATEAGFAEPDSSADIKGLDAAHKLCILANVISSKPVNYNDIYKEGIEEIHPQDLSFAGEMFNFKLKHLCVMKKMKGGLDIRVHPALLPQDDMLAAVNNENNAVLVDASNAGEVMFYGKGAGRYPAASAVVSDVIYLAQKINYGIAGQIPYVHTKPGASVKVVDINKLEFQYYVRFTTVDKPGVLSSISGILGKHKVSIASCFQKGRSRAREVPIVMISHKAVEGSFKKALKEIDRRGFIRKKSVFIRIESGKELY